MLEMPKLKKISRPYQRIAFFGPMACGKTWCAKYLVENYGYNRVAFADKLKAVAYDLYGIQGKDGPNRAILQDLGGYIRKQDSDIWIKHALYKAQHMEDSMPHRGLALDDLRYSNEAEVLKRNGFMLVKVECNEEVRQARIKHLYPDVTKDVQIHASELGWMDMVPDAVIHSDGYNTMVDLDNLLEGVPV